MQRDRPALFKGRHFEPEIIILCVRRYLRYALSLRNLEEIMAERNVYVDHVTIWRWIQRYAPELNRRCRQELRITNRSWRVDETYLRVAGKWTYLYRAVDSAGDTIDFLLSPKRDAGSRMSDCKAKTSDHGLLFLCWRSRQHTTCRFSV
jgi:transposase-like protein